MFAHNFGKQHMEVVVLPLWLALGNNVIITIAPLSCIMTICTSNVQGRVWLIEFPFICGSFLKQLCAPLLPLHPMAMYYMDSIAYSTNVSH